MKVRNLEGTRGNVVVNQFVIEEGRKTWFQSYDSIIVEIDRENEKNNCRVRLGLFKNNY